MVKIETINKLLSSHSEDDVILGVEYIMEYHMDQYKLQDHLRTLPCHVKLDIYVGKYNIVFWGEQIMGTNVYDGHTSPQGSFRLVKL